MSQNQRRFPMNLLRVSLASSILLSLIGVGMVNHPQVSQAENQLPTNRSIVVPILVKPNQPTSTTEKSLQREAALQQLRALFNAQGEPRQRIHQTMLELRPMLKHADAQVRLEAVQGFQRLGPILSRQAVRHLSPLLKDRDNDVKIATIYALAEMQENAKTVVPALKSMLNDPDLGFAAQWGLQNIDRTIRRQYLQKLLQQLQTHNPDRPSDQAVLELGHMKPIEIQPQLQKLLKHPNPQVQQNAQSVLAAIEQATQQRRLLLKAK